LDLFAVDLVPDRLDRLLTRGRFDGDPFLDEDEVLPEARAHGPHDLPRRRVERRMLELGHHLAAPEFAEVAAPILRPRIVAHLFGDVLELRTLLDASLRRVRL